MERKRKILVVDDDRNICTLLELYLRREGYSLSFAHDGSAALDAFREAKPDLVILDLMLPVISGWEVCRLIRRESDVPIIMLTARDTSEDKIAGLDLGADDYVVKPFDPGEVAARVRARLRGKGHLDGDTGGAFVTGNLRLDSRSYEVICNGEQVELSPREFQLLEYMIRNRNIVLARDRILEEVWGYDYPGTTRTVDMHVKKLREKLNPPAGWRIRTVYGIGYKFEVDAHAASGDTNRE